MNYRLFYSSVLSLVTVFALLSCSHKQQVQGDLKEVVKLKKIQRTDCALSGRVVFGPVRPVEREGMPKPDLSKWYKGRSVLIFSASPKKIVARLPLSQIGKYECFLAPGKYIIDMKLKIPERAIGLPRHITLTAGETLNFDIDIDSGLQ